MSSNNFFTNTDPERAAETEGFIAHMKKPREEVEAPDFDIPAFDDDEDEPSLEKEKPSQDQDTFSLEYSREQLWSAELALFKFDEWIAWFLAIWTGKDAKYYRRRKDAATKDDREVQLLAAIINKYQMKMSIEAAFITLFVMGYSPVFMSAYNDAKTTKKEKDKPEPIDLKTAKKPDPIK